LTVIRKKVKNERKNENTFSLFPLKPAGRVKAPPYGQKAEAGGG
jgi:hypothetical protein